SALFFIRFPFFCRHATVLLITINPMALPVLLVIYRHFVGGKNRLAPAALNRIVKTAVVR
ncbi:TPA: hypothetical protein ACYSCU_002421, partial [Citrobacter sedlakii]